MSLQERITVLLFLGIVGTIFALAGSILARALMRRRRIAARSDQIVLVLAAIGLLCIAYGFVEPYRLTVTHVSVSSAKLAKGTGPLRIVHISDLHSDPGPRLEERLPQVIGAEHPDLIVFTGDTINEPAGLPVFKACLTKIAAIAPTFVVKGNWDTQYWQDLPLFDGTGVQELNGTSVNMKLRGVRVGIAGVGVLSELRTDRALAGIPPDAFKIFLYHYPDLMRALADRHVDLYLAGHTHGGQIALPFYGALMTLSSSGKKYEAGLFHERGTWLYVNRGIGMEGAVPRVRFWSPPEVTVIDVNPESGKSG